MPNLHSRQKVFLMARRTRLASASRHQPRSRCCILYPIGRCGNKFSGTITFLSDSSISIPVADVPAAGQTISVRRETPIDAILDTLQASSTVKAGEHNLNNQQLLYALQEAADAVAAGEQPSDTVAAIFTGAYTDNYASLRSLYGSTPNPANGQQVMVGGNTSIGDGGQGIFYYDSSDTSSADNAGTIIVDSQSRRWKRLPPNERDVELSWFSSHANAATAAAGKRLCFPPGTTSITAQIVLGADTEVYVPRGAVLQHIGTSAFFMFQGHEDLKMQLDGRFDFSNCSNDDASGIMEMRASTLAIGNWGDIHIYGDGNAYRMPANGVGFVLFGDLSGSEFANTIVIEGMTWKECRGGYCAVLRAHKSVNVGKNAVIEGILAPTSANEPPAWINVNGTTQARELFTAYGDDANCEWINTCTVWAPDLNLNDDTSYKGTGIITIGIRNLTIHGGHCDDARDIGYDVFYCDHVSARGGIFTNGDTAGIYIGSFVRNLTWDGFYIEGTDSDNETFLGGISLNGEGQTTGIIKLSGIIKNITGPGINIRANSGGNVAVEHLDLDVIVDTTTDHCLELLEVDRLTGRVSVRNWANGFNGVRLDSCNHVRLHVDAVFDTPTQEWAVVVKDIVTDGTVEITGSIAWEGTAAYSDADNHFITHISSEDHLVRIDVKGGVGVESITANRAVYVEDGPYLRITGDTTDRSLTPTGAFPVGYFLTIKNQGATNDLDFDPSGINVAITNGTEKSFLKLTSGWVEF